MKIISIINTEHNHAGLKAPEDVTNILKRKYKDLQVETLDLSVNNGKNYWIEKISNLFMKLKFMSKLSFDRDLKIVQYPIKPIELLKLIPKKNSVLFIHDILGLRYLNGKQEKKELGYFKKFKYIIVHNNKMKDYLVAKGIKKEKMYVLELFDYLIDEDQNIKKHNSNLSINYAGNLLEIKCPFIYHLKKENKFKLNLYGNDEGKNVKYANYIGSFKPNELPNKMVGNYGLVWDGEYDDNDASHMYKNYTIYNNPHKFSCYIASGTPVIVWEKAAIAEFVKKYDIGYTIRNLDDIDKLDVSDYATKEKNVLKVRKKIINGYYTEKVFDKILKDSKNKI